MTQRYFVNADGAYLGSYDGPDEGMPDEFQNATEALSAPSDGRQLWSDGKWGAIPETVPDSVSARQFRLQLRRAGLLDSVKAWIATQDGETQDAFEYSGSFVRTEPMMTTGFQAMGFTPAQIDAFFVAAAKL